MKPIWKDAPSWAKFLACDGDGTWWWFEDRPMWSHNGKQWLPGGPGRLMPVSDTTYAGWLEERLL